MSKEQFHILFSGRVQGVGFRFTMQQMARRKSLGGWVRNLPDGKVEALVQASSKEWEDLCAQLRSRFDVKEMIVQKETFTAEFTTFNIE